MKTRFKILLVALFITLFFLPFQSAYATHDDFVVTGVETGGRGPLFQVYGLDGTFRLGKFVLNPNVTEVSFIQDVQAGSANHERILACGNETGGNVRGPLFHLFERDGTFVLGRFVLSPNFTQVRCETIDTDGDGVEEIIMIGSETAGPMRGHGIQIWTQGGVFVKGTFTLKLNVDDVFVEAGRD